MRMLDLFSGIGGFSLAAQWTWGDDLDIAGFCEIDEYCHKVLKKNFPGVPIQKDIRRLNGNDFKNIDLITGGFPCTDISVAGRGKGLIDEETGNRTRSGLWCEMLRVISEIRPRYALIENVPMLTLRGGTRVIADITSIGYDVEWQIIGADDVGAWHRRKRIWIVAYPNGTGGKPELREKIPRQEKEKISYPESGGRSAGGNTLFRTSENKEDVPDIDKQRLEGYHDRKSASVQAKTIPTNIGAENISNGRNYWAVEPELGRVAHGIPNRVDRLKVKDKFATPTSAMNYPYVKREKCASHTKAGHVGNELIRQVIDKTVSGKGFGYWDREPEGIPRVATGQTNRTQRLKGLGNAIVPQVAQIIMQRIKDIEQ